GGWRHVRLRHARSGGGLLHVGPRGGHGPRPARAGRPSGGRVPAADDAVRGQLRRARQPAGRADRRRGAGRELRGGPRPSRAPAPPAWPAGPPASAVLRPEALRLPPAADTQAGPAVATVVDVAFLGAHRTVRLDAGALGQLVAIGQGQSAAAPDDKVVLSWAD